MEQPTGEPVIGRLANTNARLAQLPITRIRWGEWLRRFPKTTVLALDQPDGKAAGFRYLPGAADRARHGVRFPVWQKSDRLKRDAEVYALRLGDRPKAYPLELLYARRVVNDRLGGEGLVLVADGASGAVRVYRAGGHRFSAGKAADQLEDETGAAWTLTEERLERPDGGAEPLPRVPGHIAFWFGWYGFYPQTEVYEGAP
ncbi:MAG: DUF3179 domain-containing (seleno)protein [Thermoanaerobaculia bacterium]